MKETTLLGNLALPDQGKHAMFEQVDIRSSDFWFKVVEFLQTNWALIDENPDRTVLVRFMGDTGGVFDEMTYGSLDLAVAGLKRNGFSRFEDDEKAHEFLAPPNRPFHKREHPNGRIYSSGRYWKS